MNDAVTAPTTSVSGPVTSVPAASPETMLIRALIERYAKWLPDQRPLSVFVHANPLGQLESEHFHAACEAACRIRDARTTFSADEYRDYQDSRHIRPDDVAEAKRRIAELGLRRIDDVPDPPPGTILVSRVRPEMASEIGELVDALLLRILPAFLDLGSAPWPMPHRDRGLLGALRWLSRSPLGIPEPWLSGLSHTLGGTELGATALIANCLAKRGDAELGWPHLLREAIFALPGYAGMIRRLERNRHEAPSGVRISLEEYVAVRLAVEEHALLDITRRLFGARASLATLASALESSERPVAVPAWSAELAAFQDAFEEDYVRSLVGAIASRVPGVRRENPTIHFVVCIDDRCESIRRHVEECLPECETIGAAGFFGVALKHRAPLSVDETNSCPALLTPQKRVSEELTPPARAALEMNRVRRRLIDSVIGSDISRTALGGWVASFANLVLAPRTLARMLLPEIFVEPAHDFENSRLVYDESEDSSGFTREEQVELVHGNLANIGLLSGFGRWVFIIGHGSMAMNNPFISGYQCGACGGQRGGINARVFCAFANDPENRAKLAERGVPIPEETLFVPGEHDTGLDIIRYFDLESFANERRLELEPIRGAFERALDRNARERARRFADIPLDEPLHRAVASVRRRCVDLAETRSEYDHGANAACIIGRRDLTRGLFLDRRPFLVSYDPTLDDDDHHTLERLMAAPLPVCAGINLSYFFSSMDPLGWGCGTKLPHNMQGLLGVSNGADGDLKPGLWNQTVEIHEPIRLVTIIEAEPEAITKVMTRLPAIQNYAVNAWIHLFACSPSGRGFFRWIGRGFVRYDARPHALVEVPNSLAACLHTRGNVQPRAIVSEVDGC